MSRTCIVPASKIRDYLLNPDHPDGGPKSVFFSALGFQRSKHEILADALMKHFKENDVSEVISTPYGTKYVILGALEAPDGRKPKVKSVWIRSSVNSIPIFVTAVPR